MEGVQLIVNKKTLSIADCSINICHYGVIKRVYKYAQHIAGQPAYSQTNEGSSSGELECALHFIVICPLDFEMSSL